MRGVNGFFAAACILIAGYGSDYIDPYGEIKHRLEDVVHTREYHNFSDAESNNDYLIHYAAMMPGMDKFSKNIESMRTLVKAELEAEQHTYRGDAQYNFRYTYTESPENVSKLSNPQLLRVYVLTQALNTESFRQEVGKLMQDDLADNCNEHGGLVVFRDNVPSLYNIPSGLASENNPANNESYKMSFDIINEHSYISQYHFHATCGDDSVYAGPSGGLPFFDPGDISSSDISSIFDGESHDIVITKLPGRNFNVDYYSVERYGEVPEGETDLVVLDLGNYSY